jgi:DNA-binding response OmpR family regulator
VAAITAVPIDFVSPLRMLDRPTSLLGLTRKLHELVSRIKALLRRPGHALGITLEAGNLALDTIGRDVRVNLTPLALRHQELAILEMLMRRLGRVVPKSVLQEKLYAMDREPDSDAIPVHVSNLRRRLAEAGASAVIHTVRGIGYLLAEPPG